MKHEVLETIKKELDVKFEELYQAVEPKLVKQLKRELTDKDKRNFKDGLTFDLVKAIGNYILPTDKLIYHRVNCSSRFVITCSIDRNGTKEHFETEVILAGGYNIQELHNRYICKGLKKLSKNVYFEELKNKIKKQNNLEKLQDEIQRLHENIKDYENEIITLSTQDEKYFINEYKSKWNFEEISKNWADDGKLFTKEMYNNFLDDYVEISIKSNIENIEYKKYYIKSNQKKLVKLKERKL